MQRFHKIRLPVMDYFVIFSWLKRAPAEAELRVGEFLAPVLFGRRPPGAFFRCSAPGGQKKTGFR